MWETDAHAAEIDQVLARLGASDFRRRFRLREAELLYIEERGLETIESHARDFVRTRLAPGRTAKRRAADADARTSRVYRPARDGVLLPRLSVQMARDQTGTAIDAGAAGVYRASFDDLDSAPDGGRASAALKKEGAFSVFGEGGRFFVPPRFSGKGLEKRVWPKQQK